MSVQDITVKSQIIPTVYICIYNSVSAPNLIENLGILASMDTGWACLRPSVLLGLLFHWDEFKLSISHVNLTM